jgi:hypothetical protein
MGACRFSLRGKLEERQLAPNCSPNVEPEETTPGCTALSNGIYSHAQENIHAIIEPSGVKNLHKYFSLFGHRGNPYVEI